MFPQQKFTANLLKFMEKMFLIHTIMRSLGHASGAAVVLYEDQKVQTKVFMSQNLPQAVTNVWLQWGLVGEMSNQFFKNCANPCPSDEKFMVLIST